MMGHKQFSYPNLRNIKNSNFDNKKGGVTSYRWSFFEDRIKETQKEMKFKDSKS